MDLHADYQAIRVLNRTTADFNFTVTDHGAFTLAPLGLPKEINRQDFLALTKIPYTPYFSFGEKLPVIEQGTTDPTGLGYAYETVAALIGNNLEHADLLITNRDEFIQVARTPFHLPKIPLRELSQHSVLYIDFVGLSALRTAFDHQQMKPEVQESIVNHYHSMVAEAVKGQSGEFAESDGYSFLIAFTAPDNALKCALLLQNAMLVKSPIIGPTGALRVRMAVHSSSGESEDNPKMAELRQVATLAAGRAQEGDILISFDAREGLVEPPPDIKFEDQEEALEIANTKEKKTTISMLELYKVIRVVVIELTTEERKALFDQDPGSKGGGGFQALLVAFQGRVKGNHLELNVSDRERIARYAHDYRGGGWQARLRKIFGRSLGHNLGRGNG